MIWSPVLQAGEPYDDGYPPLPDYQSEPVKKEVYIVQVKGLPWSCTAEDLLKFFSGEEQQTTSDKEQPWRRSHCKLPACV